MVRVLRQYNLFFAAFKCMKKKGVLGITVVKALRAQNTHHVLPVTAIPKERKKSRLRACSLVFGFVVSQNPPGLPQSNGCMMTYSGIKRKTGQRS